MRSIELILSRVVQAILVLFTFLPVACKMESHSEALETSRGEAQISVDLPLMDSLSDEWSSDIQYTYNQGFLFDTISKADYDKLKGVESGEVPVADSTGVGFFNDSLVISTATSRLVYPPSIENISKSGKDSGSTYTTYHGKLVSLPAYVISTWHSGSILTGSMQIIDSVTNLAYLTGSVSDGATDGLILSPGSKFLVYYSNSYHESGLGIMSFERDATPAWQQLVSFRLKGVIEDIFWTPDQRLVLRINHRERDKNWQDQYYQIASAPLRYTSSDYRNSSGDSLKLSGLNSIFKGPFIFPDPDTVRSAVIKPIDKKEFITASEMPLYFKDTAISNVQAAGYQLLLKTADSLYLLPHQIGPGSGRWYSIYKGYFPDLKLHEIYLVDGTNAVSQTLLIDSVTNQVLRPVSPFDAALSGIQFSADGLWMLAISNSVYNPEAYIGVYRVYRNESGVRLKQLIDQEIAVWNIEEVKWVGPERVLLKVSPDAFGTEKDERQTAYRSVSFSLD